MARLATRILLAAALLLSCAGASAQRTAKGEAFLSVDSSAPLTGIRTPGVSLWYGRYGLDFYWKAGGTVQEYLYPVGGVQGDGVEPRIGCIQSTAGGGAMYRLLGTYTRRLNVYAGGTAHMGWTWYVLPEGLPPAEGYEDEGDMTGGFTYGVTPSLEAELFLSRTVALTTGIHAPLYAGTQMQERYGKGLIHLTGSIGVRVDF